MDAAIATTVAGIVRSQIGKMELDEVQSNRAQLISTIQESVENAVDDWGIEVTRAEILDVNLDEATRSAMLQQLNAERARRASVTEAEGNKRSVELNADAQLYAAEQAAKARRIQADAEAYATSVVAVAIAENGIESAQYQVALKQVEALTALGNGTGKQTIVVPSAALRPLVTRSNCSKGRNDGWWPNRAMVGVGGFGHRLFRVRGPRTGIRVPGLRGRCGPCRGSHGVGPVRTQHCGNLVGVCRHLVAVLVRNASGVRHPKGTDQKVGYRHQR